MTPSVFRVGCANRYRGGDVFDSEDESSAMSTISMSLEATAGSDSFTFMSLPAEVRLNVYRFVFKYDRSIGISINLAGRITTTLKQKISLQFLRVSRAIYLEACPVLYGSNTFKMLVDHTPGLPLFQQPSRICIEHFKVQARMWRPGPSGSDRDFAIDLHAIGETLPYLKTLEIGAHNPSTFLYHALNLSNDLPCSPIRTWPLLEIKIKLSSAADLKPGNVPDNSLINEYAERLSKNFALHALDSPSRSSFGHAIPGFCKIKLTGQLSKRLSRLVDRHVSTFGDCKFHLVASRKEGLKDGIAEERTYIWRRNGEDAEASKKHNKTTSTDMHRWVPRLGKEWYAQLLDLGCDLAMYKHNEPIVRAAKQKQNESNDFDLSGNLTM